MSVVGTIIGMIVGGLVGASVVQMFYGIYKSIHRNNEFESKYKVSFKKHYKKVKVPLIKMKLGNDLRYFIVDSGAANCIMTQAAFETLQPDQYTDMKLSESIITANGDVHKVPIIETTLSFKKEKYEDLAFQVTPLTDVEKWIKEVSNITIAGILGSSFFTKYRWAIDFDERCIWVNQKEHSKEDE